jgi:hypothetical protein
VNIKELKEAAKRATPGPWETMGKTQFGDRSTFEEIEVWTEGCDVLIGTDVRRAHHDGGVENMEEALRNAKGFLDTPIRRRQFAGDEFYYAVTASIRAALEAPANPIEEVANVQR